MSLDKRIQLSRSKLRRHRRKTYEDKYDIRDKNLLLYLQTVLITAEPGVTIANASKQHVYSKFRILSFESKYLET